MSKVNTYLQITDSFTKLGWNPILQLHPYIYLDLVWEFYANMQDKEDDNISYLETTVHDRLIMLSRRRLAHLLGYQDEGEGIVMTQRFQWKGLWTKKGS